MLLFFSFFSPPFVSIIVVEGVVASLPSSRQNRQSTEHFISSSSGGDVTPVVAEMYTTVERWARGSSASKGNKLFICSPGHQVGPERKLGPVYRKYFPSSFFAPQKTKNKTSYTYLYRRCCCCSDEEISLVHFTSLSLFHSPAIGCSCCCCRPQSHKYKSVLPRCIFCEKKKKRNEQQTSRGSTYFRIPFILFHQVKSPSFSL